MNATRAGMHDPATGRISFGADISAAGAGFQRRRTCLQVLAGGAAVVMAMWAIPRYSWYGAAAAALASNVLLVVASWAAIAVLRRRS